MNNKWRLERVGNILSLEYGKALSKDRRDPGGLYPVYGANGIKDRSNEYYYDEPTLIIGRKGSAGEINYSESKFWPLDVTYFVKYDKKILDLDFIYYLFSMLELPKLAKGVKPGINRNDVYSIEVPIPPLDIQVEIKTKLNDINLLTKSLEKNYLKQIDIIDEFKNTYLKKKLFL